MADTICVAIVISSGVKCTKKKCTDGDGTRCRTHFKYVETHGPHRTRRHELRAVHKKQINEVLDRINAAPLDRVQQVEMNRELETLHLNHQHEFAILETELAQEAVLLGGDPDRPAIQRREARDREQRIRFEEAMRDLRERHIAHRQVDDLGRPQPVQRNLRNFVADPQNVHTTEAVKQTKEMIEKIRKIPVPEGYRWNLSITSKTAGEIITECKLTIYASCQMLTQYSQPTAIYDIEEGIYGKTLDSTWQFIKGHAEKESLIAILKQELEDNVGMCAQGNLTRICNVLSGYMEGIVPPESLSEKLGRLLPPLLEIEDPFKRMESAYLIMKENNVPLDSWDYWAGPLIDEEVEDVIDLRSLKGIVLNY